MGTTERVLFLGVYFHVVPTNICFENIIEKEAAMIYSLVNNDIQKILKCYLSKNRKKLEKLVSCKI